MQLLEGQVSSSEQLARQLRALLNCCFIQAIATIDDTPGGSLQDALPLDRERAGPLKVRDKRIEIILVRVTRVQSGSIWLISAETLNQVPALYELIEQNWVDRTMPGALLENSFFGISWAYWVVWIAALLIPLLFFGILSRLIEWLATKAATEPAARRSIQDWHHETALPLVFILAVITHVVVLNLPSLGFSLHFRLMDGRGEAIVLLTLLVWLLRRIATMLFKRASHMLVQRHQADTASLMLLGERLFKVLIVIAAIFAALTIAGVNTRTALAGLGIGGVAVAFGAQKTIENLLGGILLISDKALAVGDECVISNRHGTIEDITLRSVRLRTLEQTLLSIPAGMLSQANIENFVTRAKILMQTKIRLQYGTTTAQIKAVQQGIQALLGSHSQVEAGTFWVRVVDFGEHAIELDIFVYILTALNAEFLSVREGLLLEDRTDSRVCR